MAFFVMNSVDLDCVEKHVFYRIARIAKDSECGAACFLELDLTDVDIADFCDAFLMRGNQFFPLIENVGLDAKNAVAHGVGCDVLHEDVFHEAATAVVCFDEKQVMRFVAGDKVAVMDVDVANS